MNSGIKGLFRKRKPSSEGLANKAANLPIIRRHSEEGKRTSFDIWRREGRLRSTLFESMLYFPEYWDFSGG